MRMVKWITSLLLLIAISGQVWAGVCGCFDEHNDSHSCCKPDKSGKPSLAAPPCCAADCESIASSQIPGKNVERVSPEPASKLIEREVAAAFRLEFPIAKTRSAVSATHPSGHRLKFARPPDALYLRNHSFLI